MWGQSGTAEAAAGVASAEVAPLGDGEGGKKRKQKKKKQKIRVEESEEKLPEGSSHTRLPSGTVDMHAQDACYQAGPGIGGNQGPAAGHMLKGAPGRQRKQVNERVAGDPGITRFTGEGLKGGQHENLSMYAADVVGAMAHDDDMPPKKKKKKKRRSTLAEETAQEPLPAGPALHLFTLHFPLSSVRWRIIS